MDGSSNRHDIVRSLLRPGAAVGLFLWAYLGDPVSWIEKLGLADDYTDLETALYNSVPTASVPLVLASFTLLVVWIVFPSVAAAYRWAFLSRLRLVAQPTIVRNVLPRDVALNLPNGEDHTQFRFAQLEVVNGPKYKIGAAGDAENVRVQIDCFDLQWIPMKGVSSCAWLPKVEILPWANVRRITIAAGDSQYCLPFIFRPSVGWCFAPAHDFEGATNLQVHRRMPNDFHALIRVRTNASWRDVAGFYRFKVNLADVVNGAPSIAATSADPPPHLFGMLDRIVLLIARTFRSFAASLRP